MNDERELWEQRMRAREEQKEKELNILGDATVRPLKKKEPIELTLEKTEQKKPVSRWFMAGQTKTEKNEKLGKTEKAEKTEKLGKNEKLGKKEKLEKNEKSAKNEKSEKEALRDSAWKRWGAGEKTDKKDLTELKMPSRRQSSRRIEPESESETKTPSRRLSSRKAESEGELETKTLSRRLSSRKVESESELETKTPSRSLSSRKAGIKSESKLATRQTAAAKEENYAETGAGGSMVRRQLEEAAAKKKRRRRMITMIVAECIALFFIFGYAYVARQLNKLQRPEDFKISELETNELNVETVETMKGYWTIAIFGVDARNNAINKGTNADVNMVCNINRDTGEIRLVSVFRDTYLNISEGGSYNKLNQAYFVGGPEQAVQALNRNLDLQINDYMTFNWKAVADAINILGGVDIELSDAEYYYINGFITETVKATGVPSKHLTHSGMNHLDGVQAVAYGRLRLMDTDFARTERQRKVIAQAFQKAKSADFKTLNTLIGTVFPQVSTSIWVDDLVGNAKNISKFHLGETTGFPQARGDVNMGKKGAVVVPQTLETNVVRLHEFLFGDENYAPSQTVKNISAKISADTGMYKEGKYIEHVNTEGVIQKPKATAAAKKEETKQEETKKEETKKEEKKTTEAETDENGEPIEAETDEDGNLVESETDEDGDMAESETDEAGNPISSENGTAALRPTTSLKPETRPTEAETDEDGEPIESEEDNGAVKPTTPSTKPTSSTKPSSLAKPTPSTGAASSTKPNSSTKPASTPESTTSAQKPTQASGVSGNGTASGPGASSGKGSENSSASSNLPNGNGVVSAPGGEVSPAATVPAAPAPGQSAASGTNGPSVSGTGVTTQKPTMSASPSYEGGAVAGPGQ